MNKFDDAERFTLTFCTKIDFPSLTIPKETLHKGTKKEQKYTKMYKLDYEINFIIQKEKEDADEPCTGTLMYGKGFISSFDLHLKTIACFRSPRS